ncbi:hypothetical protein [Agromyces silvae]|uniref:hypothetical protein n=1 Tax=Agromyces silvae TaxID=3388266 RepID=UPI00280C023A|nr:hypothetical protein [Agromyces protaetiae]
MSQGPSTFDPRYDIRYQRGYTPPSDEQVGATATDVSSTTDASSATQPVAAQPVAVQPVAPDPEAARGARTEPAPTDERVTRAPAEPRPAGSAPDAAAPGAAADLADPVAPVTPAAPWAHAIVARWLWLVFGAGAAFTIVGTALYWSVVSRQNPFESGAGARDTTVDQILTSLTPAIVQAGVLGMVGALLAWALIGARGAHRDRAR